LTQQQPNYTEFGSNQITDEEVSKWLVSNSDKVESTIIHPTTIHAFIDIIAHETKILSERMTIINKIKQKLQQQQQQQQQQVNGGSHRRYIMYAKKSRKTKSKKTKSRRH
jgi:hypothetical protein